MRYVQKCMQQWKWRKFPKIVKSAELISHWRSWLNRQSIKSDEIVKSINIYSVWLNFVKSTIFVTPCNTGLKENLFRETLFHFFHPIVIISTAQSYVAQPFGNFTNMLKGQLHLFCLFYLKPLQYLAKQRDLKEAYGFNNLLSQHSSRTTSPFHPR